MFWVVSRATLNYVKEDVIIDTYLHSRVSEICERLATSIALTHSQFIESVCHTSRHYWIGKYLSNRISPNIMSSSSLPESNTSLTYTYPSSPPHLTHTPIPKPGPQDVLVRIKAAAINPVDIQLWGNPVLGWLAGKKEKGIGRDYSGEIVEVGDEVKKSGKWNVGDEVYGLCNRATAEGTFTQYLSIGPEEPMARKPRDLTHQQAAAIPLVVLTAFACLDWLPTTSQSPNKSQRRVIVSGASGGVGIWCVQLAKKVYDCHVIGVCSGRNADFVKELGADEVIDYGKQDVIKTLREKRGKEKYDLYIDCVGGTEMFNHWVSQVTLLYHSKCMH